MLLAVIALKPNARATIRRSRRQRRARQSARAKRHDRGPRRGLLEALAIAPKHLDVRQQVMRERHRLRALQMRVAGHDRRDVPPRDPNQRGAQLRDQRNHAGQLVAQVKPHVERDLIVARSPGVQLAPRLANQRNQPPLDREMDIFIGDIELEASALDLIFDPLEPARRSRAPRSP